MPVGRERCCLDPADGVGDGGQVPRCGRVAHVPHVHLVFAGARGQAGPIGSERDHVHPAAIAGDGHEPLRSGRVAHSPQDYLVRAARGEEPPVGGERYCAHAFEIPVLRQQAKIVWPGRVSHIPQVHLGIDAAGGQEASAGGERHRAHVGMSGESGEMSRSAGRPPSSPAAASARSSSSAGTASAATEGWRCSGTTRPRRQSPPCRRPHDQSKPVPPTKEGAHQGTPWHPRHPARQPGGLSYPEPKIKIHNAPRATTDRRSDGMNDQG
jgi:hypothetical protein